MNSSHLSAFAGGMTDHHLKPTTLLSSHHDYRTRKTWSTETVPGVATFSRPLQSPGWSTTLSPSSTRSSWAHEATGSGRSTSYHASQEESWVSAAWLLNPHSSGAPHFSATSNSIVSVTPTWSSSLESRQPVTTSRPSAGHIHSGSFIGSTELLWSSRSILTSKTGQSDVKTYPSDAWYTSSDTVSGFGVRTTSTASAQILQSKTTPRSWYTPIPSKFSPTWQMHSSPTSSAQSHGATALEHYSVHTSSIISTRSPLPQTSSHASATKLSAPPSGLAGVILSMLYSSADESLATASSLGKEVRSTIIYPAATTVRSIHRTEAQTSTIPAVAASETSVADMYIAAHPTLYPETATSHTVPDVAEMQMNIEKRQSGSLLKEESAHTVDELSHQEMDVHNRADQALHHVIEPATLDQPLDVGSKQLAGRISDANLPAQFPRRQTADVTSLDKLVSGLLPKPIKMRRDVVDVAVHRHGVRSGAADMGSYEDGTLVLDSLAGSDKGASQSAQPFTVPVTWRA